MFTYQTTKQIIQRIRDDIGASDFTNQGWENESCVSIKKVKVMMMFPLISNMPQHVTEILKISGCQVATFFWRHLGCHARRTPWCFNRERSPDCEGIGSKKSSTNGPTVLSGPRKKPEYLTLGETTTIKIMVDPIPMIFQPLGFSNGGYINIHCFNGGWNPRANSSSNLLRGPLVRSHSIFDGITLFILMEDGHH